MIPSFSEELEVEVESVEKPKIYFSGKVYCRRELDMITAFFRGIRGSEGWMIVHVATIPLKKRLLVATESLGGLVHSVIIAFIHSSS